MPGPPWQRCAPCRAARSAARSAQGDGQGDPRRRRPCGRRVCLPRRSANPQSLAAELARGDTALKAGNWQAAATAYRRILAQTDGKNVLVLNNYAYAQQQLGNNREALDLALRALKLAPDNPSVMDTAGVAAGDDGGDRNRALDLLREAARKAPQNKTIAEHLAKVEKG
jgi:tetratricopeptide (TPR) repeat protein